MQLISKTITGHAPGSRFLITGGVHGDEFEPMAAIRTLADEIDTSKLIGEVVLIPCVNVPAFQRGHRTGPDGLDLARTCPGRADGSVTEQIAALLSQQIRDSNFYVDLHTGGTRLMVAPLVGYMLHTNSRVLEMQRRMAKAFGLPLVWGTDGSLNGRSLSVARDANVPALYAEYLGGARCEPAGIRAYVDGCLAVLHEVGMTTQFPTKGTLTQARVVEDGRQGAGHMQVNHPCAEGGYFEPHVTLGEHVQRGQLLGTVVDVFGDRREEIHAAYAGDIIVLHTFSRIDAGTSVAVVLED